MKKGLLVTTLLCISLLCCGYSYRGEWSKATFTVSEDYVSESSNMGVIGLPSGDTYKYVQLPCTVALLEDAGYEMLDDADQKFKPWTESWSSHAYDKDGRYLNLHIRNDSDSTVGIRECNVYSITYKPSEDKEIGALPVSFGGLKPDSSVADATAIYGANSSSYDVSGTTYLAWETTKGEYALNIEHDVNGTFTSMQVNVDGSDKEYSSVWDTYDTYGESPVVRDELPLWAIGVIVLVPFIIVITTFVLIYKHIRREQRIRQSELDLQILQTDIKEEEDSDELLDKYLK